MSGTEMKWYLAGPMSGIPESNYPAFRDACVRLRAWGYEIVSPHETWPHSEHADEEAYLELLRHDAETMLTCQGIILLPGWTKSRGARFEFHIALTLDMTILFLDGVITAINIT